MKSKVVLSVGGSLLFPKHINKPFSRNLHKFLSGHDEYHWIVVIGGGYTARKNQEVAIKLNAMVPEEELDWIGIEATRMNAHLVAEYWRKNASHHIIINENAIANSDSPITLAAGTMPGHSTDYVAAMLAVANGAILPGSNEPGLINLTNRIHVYEQDPLKNPSARPLPYIRWKDYRSMFPKKFEPGGNYPFDPIASEVSENHGLTVVSTNGLNLKNLERILSGKPFRGTTLYSPGITFRQQASAA